MITPKVVISVSIICGSAVDTKVFANDDRHDKHRDLLHYLVGILLGDDADPSRVAGTLRRLADSADQMVSTTMTRPAEEPPGEPVPLRYADGQRKDCMIRIQGQVFRCSCGCNVFHTPDARELSVVKCNSCGAEYASD